MVLILLLSGYCSPAVIFSPASNYAPNYTRLEIQFAIRVQQSDLSIGENQNLKIRIILVNVVSLLNLKEWFPNQVMHQTHPRSILRDSWALVVEPNSACLQWDPERLCPQKFPQVISITFSFGDSLLCLQFPLQNVSSCQLVFSIKISPCIYHMHIQSRFPLILAQIHKELVITIFRNKILK